MSKPRTYKYNQVDVFTSTPYHGNPLAVVQLPSDEDNISTSSMLRFANWMNLSETTFLSPSTVADYKVRIFTPVEELPFAGHPTLGSAYVYLQSLDDSARAATIARGGTITQECGIGVVHLKWDASSDVLSFKAPPLTRFEDVDESLVHRVCSGLAIDRNDVTAAKHIVNGPPWFALRLKNSDAVLKARLADTAPLKDLYIGVFGEYHHSQNNARYEVRAFAPLAGDVGEDPVTGSLKWVDGFVSCFSDALYSAGIATWLKDETPAQYSNSQGTKLGRQGIVSVTQTGDDIWIGGSVTKCIEGTVVL
ncbi:hypothetical protein E3P99_03475 [Wallemia hederae]|uniref:Phenazine biosynthesis protein n=1 Tax=Wallemia hederae TaxID=1540922 RepID=A0A4T0FI43_9BASI|nr:hypothetical protein E3P99_03475 [Wallemia hederae]